MVSKRKNLRKYNIPTAINSLHLKLVETNEM